ncbi:uncharacterized protein LOC113272610 [Papaver somniferum]|uniref:uncharacterized protein LOC113272610 n=1 Tax=Papaver somniferum TaxID=3469 RepID=UPI000E6F5E83|nr:uncharacterized protein LOC113272610 [Papaver somniferum]
MSERKYVILVVVDRLIKYIHFIALHHPYTAASVAREFISHVFKLHGLPGSIVSDRDKVFTSHFWQDLFKALGTQLHLSTAYHPQTDGQTERALYGYLPPHLAFPSIATISVAVVEDYMKQRAVVLDILKETLHKTQERMKFFADKTRTDRVFAVGDKKICAASYKLQLPAEARIHPVFHVSQLKQRIGTIHSPSPSLPVLDTDGSILVIPVVVLDTRTISRNGASVPQLLIR